MTTTSTETTAVQLFTSPNKSNLRTTTDDAGEVWFVAQDVCRSLGLNNTAKALARLETSSKGSTSIHTLGGRQRVTTVNEAGLYALAMRSDKPEARAMQTWVTRDVLPAIRKTGSYLEGEEKLRSFTDEERAAWAIEAGVRIAEKKQALLAALSLAEKPGDIMRISGQLHGKSRRRNVLRLPRPSKTELTQWWNK